MSFFQALLLGLLQGVTEFLPISSSGHLILVPKIFGWPEHNLIFDTTLHLGTLLALLIYFRNDLYIILKAFLTDIKNNKFSYTKFSKSTNVLFMIIIGTIPAGIVGVLFDSTIEEVFRDVVWVSVFVASGTLIMFLADRLYTRRSLSNGKGGEITYRKSIVVGLFQALALFPGISRSGATISGGMMAGLNREESARFSFLLSIPIILLAALLQLVKSYTLITPDYYLYMLTGLIASFISGFLAIKFLMQMLKSRNLNVFIIYRIILVIFLLWFLKGN